MFDEDVLTSAFPSSLLWLAPTVGGQGSLETAGDDLTSASGLDTWLDPSDFVVFYSANFDRISRKLGALFQGDISHAEDITQQAFIEVLGRWPKIAAMKNPYGYAAKIAWNLAMKWFRARDKEQKAAVSKLLMARTEDMATLDGVDLELDLARPLSELPEQERTVTGLSMMGYTPNEISEVLDVLPATVRSRLKRARARLKAALEDPEGGSKA